MAATVHAFPVERRPAPRPTIAQVKRARRTGTAADLVTTIADRERAERSARIAELGVERSPMQLLLLATFRSLSYAQRDEIRASVEATRERFPDDPSAEGALLLMRGLS